MGQPILDLNGHDPSQLFAVMSGPKGAFVGPFKLQDYLRRRYGDAVIATPNWAASGVYSPQLVPVQTDHQQEGPTEPLLVLAPEISDEQDIAWRHSSSSLDGTALGSILNTAGVILIYGGSGTGKSILQRALYASIHRDDRVFFRIDEREPGHLPGGEMTYSTIANFALIRPGTFYMIDSFMSAAVLAQNLAPGGVGKDSFMYFPALATAAQLMASTFLVSLNPLAVSSDTAATTLLEIAEGTATHVINTIRSMPIGDGSVQRVSGVYIERGKGGSKQFSIEVNAGALPWDVYPVANLPISPVVQYLWDGQERTIDLASIGQEQR